MGTPVGFEGCNTTYEPHPDDKGQVGTLSVYRHKGGVTSCWRLSPEEIEHVVRTGVVWLDIASHSIPSVYVSGDCPHTKVDGSEPKAEPVLTRGLPK